MFIEIVRASLDAVDHFDLLWTQHNVDVYGREVVIF